METHVLEAMARGGFERVVALHDRRSGLRGFLAVHDTSVGPAFGGIRRWSYRGEGEALRDCMRLARAMTQKCALADLPAGGGKLVLLDLPDVDWERAYEYVGGIVEEHAGRFFTGPDLGTGERELGWVARRTAFVARPGPEGPGELAEATAEGVFAGIAAALRHADGEEDWPRRRVVLQGVGEVGRRLALRLRRAGARVAAADVDARRARAAARALDLDVVDPSRELELPCDVFAPCALGGILHDLSIERLRCRIVAGAANNVLARAAHAERLHARGILYVPDFVINSGALVRGALFQLQGRREPLERIGAGIGATVTELLERARLQQAPPARVAAIEARRRVELRRAAMRPALRGADEGP